MLRLLIAAVTSFIMLIPRTALTAETEIASHYVLGPGSQSCGEYLRAADAERKARPSDAGLTSFYSMNFVAFVSFAEGFLSSANFMASAYHLPQKTNLGQNTDVSGRMAFLEDYCKRNPLKDFVDAVFNLTSTLGTSR
jgi:hypothetical protein